MDINEIKAQLKDKLGISVLNEIQNAMLPVASKQGHFILYSPTGSGKTLAFLVPLLATVSKRTITQAVVISPTRELALQTHEIIKKLSLGIKTVVCYGGHNISDEINSLSIAPEIIVATPGRLVDLLNRSVINLRQVSFLVIDEFDKILELGFEEDIVKINHFLPRSISRAIMISATTLDEMPKYDYFADAMTFDFLKKQQELPIKVTVTTISSSIYCAKTDTLKNLLLSLHSEKTIVFANQRDTVEQIYAILRQKGFCCEFLHGKLTQLEREKSIALFENGTYNILVTTDLGARGIDFKDVINVVHFDCPTDSESFTHRNGRTARYGKSGKVFVIKDESTTMPEFVKADTFVNIDDTPTHKPSQTNTQTLHFKAGRKEKISKKDILGFLLKNLNVSADKIRVINVYDHYALAALKSIDAKSTLKKLNATKIKGTKVRITLAEFDYNHKLK